MKMEFEDVVLAGFLFVALLVFIWRAVVTTKRDNPVWLCTLCGQRFTEAEAVKHTRETCHACCEGPDEAA